MIRQDNHLPHVARGGIQAAVGPVRVPFKEAETPPVVSGHRSTSDKGRQAPGGKKKHRLDLLLSCILTFHSGITLTLRIATRMSPATTQPTAFRSSDTDQWSFDPMVEHKSRTTDTDQCSVDTVMEYKTQLRDQADRSSLSTGLARWVQNACAVLTCCISGDEKMASKDGSTATVGVEWNSKPKNYGYIRVVTPPGQEKPDQQQIGVLLSTLEGWTKTRYAQAKESGVYPDESTVRKELTEVSRSALKELGMDSTLGSVTHVVTEP